MGRFIIVRCNSGRPPKNREPVIEVPEDLIRSLRTLREKTEALVQEPGGPGKPPVGKPDDQPPPPYIMEWGEGAKDLWDWLGDEVDERALSAPDRDAPIFNRLMENALKLAMDHSLCEWEESGFAGKPTISCRALQWCRRLPESAEF